MSSCSLSSLAAARHVRLLRVGGWVGGGGGEGDVSGDDNRLSCRQRVSVSCLVSNDQALKRQIKQKEAITSTAHLSERRQREKLIISTPAEI